LSRGQIATRVEIRDRKLGVGRADADTVPLACSSLPRLSSRESKNSPLSHNPALNTVVELRGTLGKPVTA
jgi:hypothetical protein